MSYLKLPPVSHLSVKGAAKCGAKQVDLVDRLAFWSATPRSRCQLCEIQELTDKFTVGEQSDMFESISSAGSVV